MNTGKKTNTKFNELLYRFKHKFEHLMNNEFDYQKSLTEFENLLKTSTLILNENQEFEICSYYQSTLEQIYSIKKKLTKNLNILIKDITNLDIQFVTNINELSINLKQYTLNTRSIYKTINNEKISILNDNLMTFYNNCKEIVKNIKNIHTNTKNKKENQKEIYFSQSHKNPNINFENDIRKDSNEKNNINKKLFTSPNFHNIVLSLNNYGKNNIQKVKRASSPIIQSNNLKLKKNNENSRNKNYIISEVNNTEIYQSNMNNSLSNNIVNLAHLLIDFFEEMKNLQNAIVKKDKNVHQMKVNFEKKKLNLYSISKDIINNSSFNVKQYPYLSSEKTNLSDLNENIKSEINELKFKLSSSENENNKLNKEFNEINQKFSNILLKLKENINYSQNNSMNNSGKIPYLNIIESSSIDELIKTSNIYYKEILNYINQLKDNIKSDKNLKEIFNSLNDLQKLIEENSNIVSHENVYENSDEIINIITGTNNQIVNLLDDSNTLVSKKSNQSKTNNSISISSIINLIEKIKKTMSEKKDEFKKIYDELNELKLKYEDKNAISRNTNSFLEFSNGFGGRTFTFQSNNEYNNNININSKDNK